MDRDALAERLVDRLPERAVQIRFPAEDQREAVQGIVIIVHQHLQVIQDGGVEILCLI